MNNVGFNRSSIGSFIEEILVHVAREKASDVNFEVVGDALKIRYRKDGMFFEYGQIERSVTENIYSHLKSLAHLDTNEKKRPQDGRIRIESQGKAYHFRLASAPTHSSESLVLRVLHVEDSLSMDALGMPELVKKIIINILNKKQGLLVVGGPTGSGKTTTLYGLIGEILTDKKKFLTVEDPVECIIPGTTQVSIEDSIGLTFSKVLRAFLRQDPDVIMVGEIRDTETAKIAVQASLTGHLVLCTLHTENAVSAIARLIDLGIERPQLANTLLAVVAQRLIKQAEGFGRVAIFECLKVSQNMSKLICSNKFRNELLTLAIQEGMVPLKEEGMTLVQKGIILQEDLNQVLGLSNQIVG